MKKWYMLLAGFLIMVIAGCSSSDDVVVYGSDYTSTNIGTLKYVPAGSFQRDGTATNISTVSAFRMSKYEITMEQFVRVTGLLNPSGSFGGVVNGPVQNVSWYHALVFCNMLSMAEGLTPVYWISLSTDPADWVGSTGGAVPTSANANWDAATANWAASGYRLPTEMEWMWAAMGATSDSKSGDIVSGINTGGYAKLFAGDNGTNVIGNYAWYSGNALVTTHTVGTTPSANELGLYDMSGNVREWCWDWYGATYPSGSLTNYRGAAPGTDRVERGGDWFEDASSATVTFRDEDDPFNQDNFSGFRVVRN